MNFGFDVRIQSLRLKRKRLLDFFIKLFLSKGENAWGTKWHTYVYVFRDTFKSNISKVKLRFKKLRVCLLCWKLYIILVFWMYYDWDTIHCSSFARYWAFVANHMLMTKMKSAYIKILIWFQFGITWSADECRYLGRS